MPDLSPIVGLTTRRKSGADLRQLPANVEAEQALLGAILLDNRVFARVSISLSADHFSFAVHGRIFSALGTLIGRGQIANLVTLKTWFDADGSLIGIGGASYLVKLAEAAVTFVNAPFYAMTITALAKRRTLIAIAEDLRDGAHAEGTELRSDELIERHQGQLLEAADIGRTSGSQVYVDPVLLQGAVVPDRQWIVGDWLGATSPGFLAPAASASR